MPKRRRASDDADDDGDDDYDPSYTTTAKDAKKVGRTPRSKKRTAVNPPTAVAESEEGGSDEPNLLPQEAAHSGALHRIADADTMREPLLSWYAAVHQLRGMPWRKPYDPSLGPQERAQRAYEVAYSADLLLSLS